jgi:hypothetical protein
MHKSWVEQVLERRLRPVAAPDELWDRVQNPQRKTSVFGWKLALAAMLVVATAWAVHPRSLESGSAGEIRAWAGSLPLAPAAPKCGSGMARIRVHDRGTTLLVAKASRFTTAGFQSGCFSCHEE